jgi:pimeloyl-ACP methyl ester carboxylesterase
MPVAEINGLSVDYDVIGTGQPWAITPGGRFSKDVPGVRELAEALAAGGKQVLIWDRPNTGASQVCFSGPSESEMQCDALAGLLRHLGMTPAVIAGGSGGSRVSLLTAARHPDVAAGVAVWWISGGTYGLMSLGVHYCGDSIVAAWRSGMPAVTELPVWAEVLERNPANRQVFLDQDRSEFITTLEHWMLAYCPRSDELVPGLPNSRAGQLEIPALVFRSGASDPHHTRETSEHLAALLPHAARVEPPWPDTEWNERMQAAQSEGAGLFVRWPLLAPQLLEWCPLATGQSSRAR